MNNNNLYIGTLIFILLTTLFINVEIINKNRRYYTSVLYIDERYNYIKNEIDKTGLNVVYEKGYTKENLTEELLALNEKSPGKVCCHMGHLKIIKKFLESNYDYVFILEDDIYFVEHNMIKSKVDYIVSSCPNDAEIIYVSFCLEDKSVIDKNKIFNRASRPLCRHAYILSRNGAKKIYEKSWPMSKFPGPGGDNIYGSLVKNKEIIGYTVNEEFIKIEQNRKKLGSKIGEYNSGSAPPRYA
tara:strand:- start:84 stop:809 length:726 start_codon:yes stop_codon:yes gene_type:complete